MTEAMRLLSWWRGADAEVDHAARAEALERELGETRGERERVARGVGEMLHCIKELTLDMAEVGSEELKRGLDDLARRLHTGERRADLDGEISAARERVIGYAERLKEYLAEREGELKRIVELLTRELAGIGDANEAYHRSIYERGARIEAVSQLDDIRKMRRELQTEVAALRLTVRHKQSEDARRLDLLQHEVEELRSDVERARADALTDGLTGAWNRAALDERVALLIDRNRVTPTPFALLMIDIDHFKQINDRYGHPVGDRALVALVLACKGQLRPSDFLARYGGEEFVLVLPAASARGALRTARRLCKAQAKRSYAVEGAGALSFTISVGVTTLGPDDTAATLVARADHALYQAKHLGRNRAVFGERQPVAPVASDQVVAPESHA